MTDTIPTKDLAPLDGHGQAIYPSQHPGEPWRLVVEINSEAGRLDPANIDYLAAILAAESTRIHRLNSGTGIGVATEIAQEEVDLAARRAEDQENQR